MTPGNAESRVPNNGPDWDGRRCRGRCWFAYYGWVGSSSPWCRKCSRANPNYDPARDIPIEMRRFEEGGRA